MAVLIRTFRQHFRSSNKTAKGKAEIVLLKSKVNDLSKDEWQKLIAGAAAAVLPPKHAVLLLQSS